jgi:hypothetical protein
MPLPDETTIILIPEGGCSTDWEEPIETESQIVGEKKKSVC